ncbi:MAG: SDR family NAD(P)-dependent oxidoreductase, partial [Ilumatobacteraceae bacterium]
MAHHADLRGLACGWQRSSVHRREECCTRSEHCAGVSAFADRYGPWAIVAGASEGLGRAFSTELARLGLNVLLFARRAAPLDALADELRSGFGV